jgi:hypothetical protein
MLARSQSRFRTGNLVRTRFPDVRNTATVIRELLAMAMVMLVKLAGFASRPV